MIFKSKEGIPMITSELVARIARSGSEVSARSWLTEKKERAGVNPRTGVKMTIPAMRVPSFRAGKALKESVKKGK